VMVNHHARKKTTSPAIAGLNLTNSCEFKKQDRPRQTPPK
jgi:hypothetical protein